MERKIVSPLYIEPFDYFAEHETKAGGIEHIKVDDPRLAGMRLPATVENPEKLLRQMERQLNKPKAENTILPTNIVENKSPIIRSSTQKRSSTCDVTNFCLAPQIRYIFIDRKGEQDYGREKILCEIVFNYIQKESFYIHTKDIRNLCKIIKNRFAIARIDFETKNIERRIEDEFREAISRCRTVCCYYQQGWQLIEQKMIYVHKSAKRFNNVEYELNANLPYMICEHRYTGQILLDAFRLYNDSTTMSTMVMFSLLSVLYRPFKEAGFPPRFLLFLHGKTGSMKTTIAKILFTQLCEDEARDTPRRIDVDTVVSFERAVITSGYDTVTLIDDYNPAKSKKKASEMACKLESIIRLVGDTSSKSRSNVNLEDCRGEGVQGTVVLTGELRGKGLSSNLRCLYCKMVREKANLDLISWHQNNPVAYTTVIYEFTEYIGKNWKPIIDYIKSNFRGMRKETSSILLERRLVDDAVTLQMVFRIMCAFLTEYCGIDKATILNTVGNVEQDIINNALMSQAISCEDSPTTMFIKTVHDLMRVNSIVLNSEKVISSDTSNYDGFEDENYYYFNPESIFKKVRSFYIASNIEFSMDLREIVSALYDDGIIKPSSNGAGKQTYYARISVGNGRKESFLKIHKDIFSKVLYGSLDIIW